MKKPTVYLDTTIFSIYHHRSSDKITMGNRLQTREWWTSERQHFDLFISRVVLKELKNGHFPWQRASIRMANPIPRLRVTDYANELAATLIENSVVPAEKSADALQMAIAVDHSIDYLLTWNYSHLANPVAQHKLEEVMSSFELRVPLMV